MEDVSAEVAGLISDSKVFGASDNIRHGKYKMLIKRIFAQKVETDAGLQKMAFWELTPLTSEPNPQIEGDHVDYPGTAGPLKDDGTKPNPVGSSCGLKVNFDGPGGRSAGSNIKAAILGLFGKPDGAISNEEINKTWIDLSRTQAINVGDPIGINPQTKQVILADKAKQANPACGMVIYCTTMPKRKKQANDKGAFITKLLWSCVSPPGEGENAPELVVKRRADIEASRTDDDEVEEHGLRGGGATTNPYGGQLPSTAGAPALPQTQAATPTPPAPPAPVAPALPVTFTPPAPWRAHPTQPVDAAGTRWFWDGNVQVKSEAQLRSGQ